jgi:ParB/RepB/Spo0J family partition protein
MMNTQHIPLEQIHAHKNNPRLEPRQDVIDQIASRINGGIDEAHSLLVRPHDGGFQIISGHHRFAAAQKVGLATVPCFVREMTDDEAYMQLVLCNTQSELHPLEEGKHAAESGMDLKAYAEQSGKVRKTLSDKVMAWRVLDAVAHVRHDQACDSWRNLAELHASPRWLWAALVAKMLADSWTVAVTREKVAKCKDWIAPPAWADIDLIAANLINGDAKYSDISRMGDTLTNAKVSDADLVKAMREQIEQAKPSTLSAVQAIVVSAEQQQSQRNVQAQQKAEEAAGRVSRLRANCSLLEWEKLSDAERADLLVPSDSAAGTFNKQDSPDIEWAQWSWNPITGCKHECSYCYARDIATSARTASAFPNGFEPTFRSNALVAPVKKVPAIADTDARYKNVFTGSMTDLFGRWVPKEWIEAVLKSMRENPQWNFLTLTKFPNRITEFDIPPNAWMGTSVDLQARVANAEKAFAKIQCGIKWLSIEPLIEPLKFTRLELFDWVVIGGASPSSKTPAWRPPYRWIHDIVQQCNELKIPVYQKSNLGIANRILQLPFDAPVTQDPQTAPECFQYFGK